MNVGHADYPHAGMSRREWREHRPDLLFGSAPAPGSAGRPDGADADGPLTILTVCTGNICRSPLAEVLLRAQLESHGVTVHSAGTHALVGHEMTEPAQRLAVEAGADVSAADAHRARYLREPLLQGADLVLTMAREHSTHAVRMMPSRMRRTFTAREFARLAAPIDSATGRGAAERAGADPRARFGAVLALLADERGPVAAGSEDDDVIDPYRRSTATYERSAAQLMPALAEVERLVRIAVG